MSDLASDDIVRSGDFIEVQICPAGTEQFQIAQMFGKTVWVYHETHPSEVWRGSPPTVVGQTDPVWRFEVVGEMRGTALTEEAAKFWAERRAFEASGLRPAQAGYTHHASRVALQMNDEGLQAEIDVLLARYPLDMTQEQVRAAAQVYERNRAKQPVRQTGFPEVIDAAARVLVDNFSPL